MVSLPRATLTDCLHSSSPLNQSFLSTDTGNCAEHLAEGSPGPWRVAGMFSRKKHPLQLIIYHFSGYFLGTRGYQLLQHLRKQYKEKKK